MSKKSKYVVRRIDGYCFYINNKKEGINKTYHYNDNIASCKYYYNDKLHGIYKSYYYHGKIYSFIQYKNGKLHGKGIP
jgi:antitoxin component YwqK of YwqJK toxin-antitoxin module